MTKETGDKYIAANKKERNKRPDGRVTIVIELVNNKKISVSLDKFQVVLLYLDCAKHRHKNS